MTAAEFKARPRRKTRNDDPEHRLQVACVKWFRMQYRQYANLLFAIPNGGKRNAITAARLKAEGVTAGVPDLFLAKPAISGRFSIQDDYGLFIEMKVGKNDSTPAQKQMRSDLRNQGYAVAVCRSLEEFIEVVENYLK